MALDKNSGRSKFPARGSALQGVVVNRVKRSGCAGTGGVILGERLHDRVIGVTAQSSTKNYQV
jgi:hypothetical protein